MRLGDIANETAASFGKPLEGVRVLAAEQMAALPYATQLLARLGADVVKVEHPEHGESGRGAHPAIDDPAGRPVGATFVRNNLNKKSVGIDLKHPDGVALFLRLAERFDVVCENFKAGTADRLGIGYDAVQAVNPAAIYLSVSGYGNSDSPYRDWPAYASITEAMSGIYDFNKEPGRPPRPNPVGALGDISSGLFGVIGVLAALRHRDTTGLGQRVDIAMLDSVLAMTDIVTNMYSMGVRPRMAGNVHLILDAFEAADGYFVVQVVREHQFALLAEAIGHPEWADDPRFADRSGWVDHLDDVIRPAIESWAASLTHHEAAGRLAAAGLAASPCLTAAEVIADEHVATRHMLVEMEPPSGGEPVLIPGNPVKLSNVAEGPETRIPWVGEHTDSVLADELGLTSGDLDQLRRAGVVSAAP